MSWARFALIFIFTAFPSFSSSVSTRARNAFQRTTKLHNKQEGNGALVSSEGGASTCAARSLAVNSSTFVGNEGGGLAVLDGDLSIVSSNFSDNTRGAAVCVTTTGAKEGSEDEGGYQIQVRYFDFFFLRARKQTPRLYLFWLSYICFVFLLFSCRMRTPPLSFVVVCLFAFADVYELCACVFFSYFS